MYLECICGAFSKKCRAAFISGQNHQRNMGDGKEVQRAMLVGDNASSAICAQSQNLQFVYHNSSKPKRVCFSPASMVTWTPCQI